MAPESYTHIEKYHGSNAPTGKGKFDNDVDYDELVDEAAKFAPKKQTNGRCNRVCTLPDNRIIGKDQSGLPTNVYTVVTEENGRVVTMHPGLPN